MILEVTQRTHGIHHSANEFSEEVHVSLRHLRRLSGDDEGFGKRGRLGEEDVRGATVLLVLCATSSANGAPVGSAASPLHDDTSRFEVGGPKTFVALFPTKLEGLLASSRPKAMWSCHSIGRPHEEGGLPRAADKG